jgi:DNA-binding CsgD family transcriptional regulator
LEVLQLVCLGLTDRQIGERLLICTKTASTHVAHILDKLDAASRAHAVSLGYRRGLLSWQEESLGSREPLSWPHVIGDPTDVSVRMVHDADATRPRLARPPRG